MSSSPPSRYITVPRFSRIPWLTHGFGTRSWVLEDFKKHKDRKKFLGISLSQVHSSKIHFIDKVPERHIQGDALATDKPELILIVRTADCLPVFLADESKRVVASVHCGRRGTRERILEHVVLGLHERYGCEPTSLLAALGPCIASSCYEVGDDVRHSFYEARLSTDVFRPHPRRLGKYFLDLREANRAQLLAQGLRLKNILNVAICTHCDANFHSYRRDRRATGRLLNFIGIISKTI